MAEGSENAPAALVMGFCACQLEACKQKKCHPSELFCCVEKIILSRQIIHSLSFPNAVTIKEKKTSQIFYELL